MIPSFVQAYVVYITAMISFVFISFSAVQIYIFIYSHLHCVIMFKFRCTLLHLTVKRTFFPLENKSFYGIWDFWIQLIKCFFFSFNYLTDQALQCRSVYLPSITVLGLYQAHCRAGSADSTAGSGSHGETGKCCQKSCRFDEDHSGGRCLESIKDGE